MTGTGSEVYLPAPLCFSLYLYIFHSTSSFYFLTSCVFLPYILSPKYEHLSVVLPTRLRVSLVYVLLLLYILLITGIIVDTSIYVRFVLI